ncbi:MAG TPA: hypothetical protein VIJ41_04955 [Candidatus Nanopelagicales bacterium]
MTSNRRLHRIAAFTAVSVLFAVTSSVSALASGHEQQGAVVAAPVSPVVVSVAVDVEPTPSASTVTKVVRAADTRPVAPAATPTIRVAVKPAAVNPAAVKPTAAPAVHAVVATSQDKPAAAPAVKPVAEATAKPAPKPAPAQPVAAAVSAKPITISSYVDAPGSQAAIDKCHLVLWAHHPLWLAGHNWCGFQWMAYVATGTTVRVTAGAAAGTYVVIGHVHLDRQGGAMPPTTGADLVLQTCTGSGTGLTLLHRTTPPSG